MPRKRSEALMVRLTEEEAARLKEFAEAKGWTVSQVIRELIKTLPTQSEKITLFS